MKKSILAAAMAAAILSAPVRARTHDVAYTYRMPAGFPGDVNRTHPASILPRNMSTAAPVVAYGYPGLYDGATATFRAVGLADSAITKIDGILVRPFPTQQTVGGMTSTIGAATPPVGPAVVDVLEQGFIIVQLSDFAAAPPQLGGPVYIWTSASTGTHVLGGFEAADGGSDTATITNARFASSGTDNVGVTEIEVWTA